MSALPYLLSPDAVPTWPSAPDKNVTKIVLGQVDEGSKLKLPRLPDNFAALFPNLKLLHLWNLGGLKSLPALPPDLEELDLRDCAQLESLPELPAGLRTLVLGGAAKLKTLIVGDCGAMLDDLWIKDCPALAQEPLHALLKAAPGLKELVLSNCTQLNSLPETLPDPLRVLICNGCGNLATLPGYWPGELRRLELAETAVTTLPEFPETLDYVNLSGCEKLHHIPEEWHRHENPLRTLLLFESAVQEPPASEHGSEDGENVAARTLGYFRDRELAGQVDVLRCKVLFLGNGHAGKTCLSLSLRGLDPKNDNPGSTHGIQFALWPLTCRIDGRSRTITRQVWDFGGQEIYHNTHQLFMKAGAVFILLWDPTQDGKQPPLSKAGYQDTWRPLRYWVDYLRLYGPRNPRILVACNCRPEVTWDEAGKADLTRRYKEQMAGLAAIPTLHFVDACEQTGELQEVNSWIEKNVEGEVVQQGTSVPSYWEVAQRLVEHWTEARSPLEMSVEDFERELQRALEAVKTAPGPMHRLATALRKGTFALNRSRVERTLTFLTNSGWVYWSKNLFQEQVIISQQWALEGIYAALDRRPETEIYRLLAGQQGRFTKETLGEAVWTKAGFSDAQQDLLLSYMEQAGVCFTLIQAADRWWDDAVHVSLAHLPEAAALSLEQQLDGNPSWGFAKEQTLHSPWLHQGHWHRILAKLGAVYGREADYCQDGFSYRTPRHAVLVLCRPDAKGIGGDIIIRANASDEKTAKELLDRMSRLIQAELPTDQGRPVPPAQEVPEPAGKVHAPITVFISYAWNPRKEDAGMVDAPVPPEYEAPVNFIEAELNKENGLVKVLRDKNEIGAKDIVMDFLNLVKKSDRVLVFHSKKYWKSLYCLYEFWSAWAKFCRETKTIQDTFILVGYADSRVFEDAIRVSYQNYWSVWHEEYKKFWGSTLTESETLNLRSIPTRLAALWPVKDLFGRVDTIFRDYIPELHRMSEYGKTWEEAKKDEIMKWIKKEIGHTPPTPALPPTSNPPQP